MYAGYSCIFWYRLYLTLWHTSTGNFKTKQHVDINKGLNANIVALIYTKHNINVFIVFLWNTDTQTSTDTLQSSTLSNTGIKALLALGIHNTPCLWNVYLCTDQQFTTFYFTELILYFLSLKLLEFSVR